MSIIELCVKYGLSAPSIYNITKGIPRPSQVQHVDRNVAMIVAYEKGEMNTIALSEKYGISCERVCQILRPTNVIATAMERRQIAKEAIKAEADTIKAEAKAKREQLAAQAVELVRQGYSIAEVQRRIDLPINVIPEACKAARVESRHGRWRDMTSKINRVRELRGMGMSWNLIRRQCIAEGHGTVFGKWVSRHTPDLVRPHDQRSNGEAMGVPPPAKLPKALRSQHQDQETVWTEEAENRLIDLWLAGTTAQQCADIFGPPTTRNAIIGKINRLRNDGRFSKVKTLMSRK